MSPIESDGTHKENDMTDRYVSIEDGDAANAAESLAGYLVHALKTEDVLLPSFRKTERDLEEWFTLCLGDEEFQETFLAAAVWILRQRSKSDRLYYIDEEGGVGYHILVKEEPIRKEVAAEPPVSAYVAQFGGFIDSILGNDDSSSNEEGSE